MYTIQWLDDAITSLEDIFTYIAEQNPYAATALLHRIQNIVNNIAYMPLMYPVPDPALPTLRQCSMASPYLIFYRVDEENKNIDIVDIIHGARNIRSRT